LGGLDCGKKKERKGGLLYIGVKMNMILCAGGGVERIFRGELTPGGGGGKGGVGRGEGKKGLVWKKKRTLPAHTERGPGPGPTKKANILPGATKQGEKKKEVKTDS